MIAANYGFITDTIISQKEYCNEIISNSFDFKNVLFALNQSKDQIQILVSISVSHKIQDTYVITVKSQIEYQDYILSFIQYPLVT